MYTQYFYNRSVDYGACLKLLEAHGFEFDMDYAINQAYTYNNHELLEALIKTDTTANSNTTASNKTNTATTTTTTAGRNNNRINTMYLLHRGVKDRKKAVYFKLLLRCGVDVNYVDNEGKLAAFYASKCDRICMSDNRDDNYDNDKGD